MATATKDDVELSLSTLAAMVRMGMIERRSLVGQKLLVQYVLDKGYMKGRGWRTGRLHEVGRFAITQRKSDGCIIMRKLDGVVSSWYPKTVSAYVQERGLTVYHHHRSPHNYDLSSLIDRMSEDDIRKQRKPARAAYAMYLNALPIPGPTF